MYEFAQQCLALRKQGLSCVDISHETGVSAAHIGNLLRCLSRLHPSIIAAWKERDSRATLRTLISLAATKDQFVQLLLWNGSTQRSLRRPTVRYIQQMCNQVENAVKSNARSAEWASATIDALNWACGLIQTIPGIINPPKRKRRLT